MTDNIDPRLPGTKLDHDKPRCGLVLGAFSQALMAVSKVGTFGAAKYSDNGWLSVPSGAQRYRDALYRHMLAAASGEVIDPESGLPHEAHVAWNALAILELGLRSQVAVRPSAEQTGNVWYDDEPWTPGG